MKFGRGAPVVCAVLLTFAGCADPSFGPAGEAATNGSQVSEPRVAESAPQPSGSTGAAAAGEVTTSVLATVGDQGSAGNSEQATTQLVRYDLVAAAGYTRQDEAVVDDAWSLLFSECMRNAGFATDSTPPPVSPNNAEWSLKVLRFDDIALIESRGYHWLIPSAVESASDPGSEAEGLRVPESVQDACRTSANEVLSEGSATGSVIDPLIQANADIYNRLRSSLELQPARDRWGTCMSDKGYSELDISESVWFLDFVSSDDVSDLERATALADATCRSSSRYTEERLDLLAEQIANWLSDNEGVVIAIRLSIANEVARAKEVLGRTP